MCAGSRFERKGRSWRGGDVNGEEAAGEERVGVEIEGAGFERRLEDFGIAWAFKI